MSEVTFEAASQAAESWLNTTALVSEIGRISGSVDAAWQLLEIIQQDYAKYSGVLRAEFDNIRAFSDKPIEWELGRGLSGICAGNGTFPHIWSSAHEAAEGIARLALVFFVWPLDTEFELWPGSRDVFAPVPKEPIERRKIAYDLLADRWNALVIPIDEVARLQERIRRERAKLLKTNKVDKSKSGDDQWSEARSPKEWRMELALSRSAMQSHIDNGRLIVDKLTSKLWKIRLDTLRRFKGDRADK